MATAVVYYSGTGNTEKMANAIAEAISTAELISAENFTADMVANYDGFIFGCPASGAEELEEGTFAPMWESVKDSLSNKKVALFGSYGWGGGEFMETWKEDCSNSSIDVIQFVVCEGEPDDDAIEACKELAANFS